MKKKQKQNKFWIKKQKGQIKNIIIYIYIYIYIKSLTHQCVRALVRAHVLVCVCVCMRLHVPACVRVCLRWRTHACVWASVRAGGRDLDLWRAALMLFSLRASQNLPTSVFPYFDLRWFMNKCMWLFASHPSLMNWTWLLANQTEPFGFEHTCVNVGKNSGSNVDASNSPFQLVRFVIIQPSELILLGNAQNMQSYKQTYPDLTALNTLF